MAKWSGIIGYIKLEQVERGIWSDGDIIERTYYGDLISNRNKTQQSSDSTNSTIMLSSNVSIIADEFAIANFGDIKYVIVKGVKWIVTDIDYQHPRLIITIGGIYNGK